MSMSQKRLTPGDGMFLYMETPETMMHVAGLLPFSPPPDAPPDLVRGLVDEIRDAPVFPPWNRRLSTPDVLLNPLQSWIEEQNLDLEVHVPYAPVLAVGFGETLGLYRSVHNRSSVPLPWRGTFSGRPSGGSQVGPDPGLQCLRYLLLARARAVREEPPLGLARGKAT